MWNWCIRLVLEAALELSFSVFLNLQYGKFDDNWAEQMNMYFSIFFAVCLVFGPAMILIFYCKNFDRLDDEEFEDKWGAPYEGLDKMERLSLLYPCLFITRRVILGYISIHMHNFLPGQLAI